MEIVFVITGRPIHFLFLSIILRVIPQVLAYQDWFLSVIEIYDRVYCKSIQGTIFTGGWQEGSPRLLSAAPT